MKKLVTAPVAVAALAFLVGCTGGSGGGATIFEQAYQDCEATSGGIIVDDGSAALLTLDTKSEDRKRLLDDSLCILNSFSPPQTVQSHILSTSSLDGFQEASWNGISAQWRYHPDLGIVITLTEAEG